MKKTKLPSSEVEICTRLREAREFLGITQEKCSSQLGIERTTLASYEYLKAPLRYEIALRFCRQLVISEEWLATGKTKAMEAAVIQQGLPDGGDWSSLKTIFIRQCMDLLAEPIVHEVPPGMLFSEAYEKFFSPIYAELSKEFCYAPRLILSSHPEPELGFNLIGAYLERWLKMISNESLRLKQDSWKNQRSFLRAIIQTDGLIFKRYMGLKTPEVKRGDFDFLRTVANLTDSPIGPLHVVSSLIKKDS